jgi:DNA gyrase/topoisomerase IV subunit B
VSRFKGLGEMMAAQLKETTMDPKQHTPLRVTLIADDRKDTAKSVERLMAPSRNCASSLSRSARSLRMRRCWMCSSSPAPRSCEG